MSNQHIGNAIGSLRATQGKQSFFEKKDQKAFLPAKASTLIITRRIWCRRKDKSFLVLFFKKGLLAFDRQRQDDWYKWASRQLTRRG